MCIWGSTFVSSKVLLMNGLTPSDIFFYRFLLAYIGMVIISHKKLFADNFNDELKLFGLGLMGGSLYFMAENYALTFSPASNVSIIVCSTPLYTAMIVGLFYKSERLTKRQFLFSIIALIGMALIVMNGQWVLHISPLGDLLAFVAAFSWALYSLLIKSVSAHYDLVFITRKVFFYGLITILPYLFFVNPLNTDITFLFQPNIISNLLFLCIIASWGCFLTWNWVLNRIGIVNATNYIYIQSLITMLVANIVLHERITGMAILGTLVLIIGMIGIEKLKKVRE